MQRAANAEQQQLEQKTYLRFWTTLNLCRIPTKNLNCRIQGQKKFWWHLKWPCYYRLNLQYHKAWKITPQNLKNFAAKKLSLIFAGEMNLLIEWEGRFTEVIRYFSDIFKNFVLPNDANVTIEDACCQLKIHLFLNVKTCEFLHDEHIVV